MSIWGENPQHGVAIGFINGSTGDSGGFTWGLANYADSYHGVEWAVVNYSKTSFVGWQGGLINYSQGTFSGFQSGLVNLSQEFMASRLGW